MPTSLSALSDQGVAVWLDDLSRSRLTTGALARLVAGRDVVGVTTNPSIFEAAIAGSELYVDQIRRLAAPGTDAEAIVRALITDDVAAACDILAPLARTPGSLDGRVSLEVDPRLAHDTDATIAQGRELWAEIGRANLLIKVPATPAGLPAIRALVAEGISVNVTLIFSLERYRAVMEAYIAGLEDRLSAGLPVHEISSVASFFVSRVDNAIDPLLEAIGTPAALALRGSVAIANARLAYFMSKDTFTGSRWASLAAAGARPQRPLWASTGVKNTAYPDTLYVTELVAPGTVNTMPQATLDAVAHHGVIRGNTIAGTQANAAAVIADLGSVGVELDSVTNDLEAEGVAKFQAAWTGLLRTVEAVMARATVVTVSSQR